MEPHDEDVVQCPVCQRELVLGSDVIAVTRGVLGHRGVVPLDDTMCICSDECLLKDLDSDPPVKMKRRIP